MNNAEKSTSKIKRFIDFALPVVIGFAIAGVLKSFVFINVVVPTESMVSTIEIGDRLIGSRLAYLSEGPERGDVVTFDYPDNPDILFVKRVVGLPGETITIFGGKVYINDSVFPLDEPYVNSAEIPEGDFGPYVVPDDCYFVLGDNRNHSVDSRYWETTNFVAKDCISSKVLFRYYPSFENVE